ncbi:MFS transporter [Pseudoalteromonas denitrificans]|jgi:MFS family permease|uniref:Predicted arabinose efflux permease, MFS family n=1 Tax=Pseudoalteromonas denitrificans DSM 6059 TaxID=1123010 RepID=A0A1I1RMM6_9GAMM|nr:MFS transporter [Pseudoalteromonas denitrificans]SFD32913.1 Predicted arabinose efflux permease, MFS family [Pseudoalteromonas denitrificans DSM 6059]
MPLFLAILFLSCSQFASQIFLPAMPDIAIALDISKSQLQQVMMYYFISLGFSQLIVGPLCDSFGNRKVFLVGQISFILGTCIAGLAINENIFALGRVLQGFGAAAPLLISRILLGSELEGSALKSATASLSIAASLVAVVAPWFGGLITTHYDWQILFFVLTVYFITTWFIGYVFLAKHETGVVEFKLKNTLRNYMQLLIQQKFISIAMFKWIPTFLYLTSQIYFPFELQEKFNLSAAEYGKAMMIPTAGLVLGTLLAKILQKYISYNKILLVFWPLILASGIVLYAMPFSLFSALLSYSLLMVAFGTYYPCCIHLIVTSFKKYAGAASALVGAVELLCFSILAIFINKFFITSYLSLALIYIAFSFVLLLCWLLMKFSLKKTNNNKVKYVYRNT